VLNVSCQTIAWNLIQLKYQVIVEEIEEGEIVENDQVKKKPEIQSRVDKPATPKKNVRRSTGEELEEGEIVSSDEESQPPPVLTRKTEKKTTQSSPNNAALNNKDKRGVENKENRADKKKKGMLSFDYYCAVFQ
jgi:hypothetical protein